ncbi:MAG: thioredoxin domain-containing protein [Gemmatimonadota bacterium]
MIDRLASIALIVAALVFSVTLIHGEFFSAATRTDLYQPKYIEEWSSALGASVNSASPDAPVQIMAFVDYQCPACAVADSVIRQLRRAYPTEVAVHYLHYPLPAHPQARVAALAVECAMEFQRFDEMAHILYSGQEWFGVKRWDEYADDAGIADIAQFNVCMAEAGHIARIEAGLRWGETFAVLGTPTLVINGWMFFGGLTYEQLDTLVSAVRSEELRSDLSPEDVSAIVGHSFRGPTSAM